MTGLEARLRVPGRLDVVVRADPGEVLAIVGPNGAGKTTLLEAIAGLTPFEGELRVGGESWSSPLRRIRDRNVGLVFQDQRLFPHLSALDNVAFGPRARGVARREAERRARDWLARFGIVDLAGRRTAELSGGESQRVAIARALAGEPALLLLDEPFSDLDVGVAGGLRVELSRHLADYDGITLLVTHDAIDALTLAGRVLALEGGRVAQEGTPLDLAARPLTEHVARLVGLNVVRDGSRFMAFSPSVVTVSPDEPHGSARHRWRGAIVHTAPHGGMVRLLVSAERDVMADVTPESVTELGLRAGREVWLSVKEAAVATYEVPEA